MATSEIVLLTRKELQKNADAKTKKSFQRFFKEEVKCHGVKSAAVGRVIKASLPKIKDLTKKEVFALGEELLASGYCEEAWVAASWAHTFYKDFEPNDFKVFESWIDKYIDNWAECDTFCNHTLGAFIKKYPEFVEKLKLWTKSKNRWLKRAAAVSLIVPAKEGKFLKDAFEIADSLLQDQDDMVQKGYGWLLKEESRKHPKEVFVYLMKYQKVMPRTAFRYALEKMPEDLKKKAMGKV